MSEQQVVVTIDGPAASGKTSLSRELAARLGWQWVSTGAFYRGLAYVATVEGASLDDEDAILKISRAENWEVRLAPEKTKFFYNGTDVTEKIYAEDVGTAASKISQYPRVRESLREAQRNCAVTAGKLVAEGRDCGTVVFPGAQVKLFVTADSRGRAVRRAVEQGRDLEETVAAQAKRDAQDMQRKASPLKVPENAHVIDTSKMSLDEVVSHADQLVREALATSSLSI